MDTQTHKGGVRVAMLAIAARCMDTSDGPRDSGVDLDESRLLASESAPESAPRRLEAKGGKSLAGRPAEHHKSQLRVILRVYDLRRPAIAHRWLAATQAGSLSHKLSLVKMRLVLFEPGSNLPNNKQESASAPRASRVDRSPSQRNEVGRARYLQYLPKTHSSIP